MEHKTNPLVGWVWSGVPVPFLVPMRKLTPRHPPGERLAHVCGHGGAPPSQPGDLRIGERMSRLHSRRCLMSCRKNRIADRAEVARVG